MLPRVCHLISFHYPWHQDTEPPRTALPGQWEILPRWKRSQPSHNIKATGYQPHFRLFFLFRAKQTEQDVNLHFPSPNPKRDLKQTTQTKFLKTQNMRVWRSHPIIFLCACYHFSAWALSSVLAAALARQHDAHDCNPFLTEAKGQ